MVDLYRRKRLAHHLRHLSVGLTTNDDFEDKILEDVTYDWLPEQYYRSKQVKTDDAIILPMLELSWGLYDDTRRHKLTGGSRLNDDALKIISRCILFLNSEQEYQWPYFDVNNILFKFSLKDFVLVILTLGQNYRNKKQAQKLSYEEWKKVGEYDVWPFFSKSSYAEQLKTQPFLRGSKSLLHQA